MHVSDSTIESAKRLQDRREADRIKVTQDAMDGALEDEERGDMPEFDPHDAEVVPDGEADEFGTEDFDAFWTNTDRKRRRSRVMGQLVEFPPSLPLRFQLEAKRLQRSDDLDDVKRLLAILFHQEGRVDGQAYVDNWTDQGLDLEQFMVLLAWAPTVVVGDPTPLAEVYETVRSQFDKDDDTDPS